MPEREDVSMGAAPPPSVSLELAAGGGVLVRAGDGAPPARAPRRTVPPPPLRLAPGAGP
ncbi:MAG: hypothetical protein MUC96_20325 [Myxococcaceae bacterium]|nr:hypothetical protein [Myxococcaceae bacterium]